MPLLPPQVVGGVAGAAAHHAAPGRESGNLLMGNACLLLNTMAMAVYYILAKQAVQRYPAISVASWAYLVGELLAASTERPVPKWPVPEVSRGPAPILA